jgi:hypothetical protein
MKIIAPKQLMENQAPIIRNGGIFSRASLDLQFARTRTLDPRVTHTRQSSATYVDGDGVIRTAVTNLLLRSEEFDNASWTKFNSAATPNTSQAPDGTLTADYFNATNPSASFSSLSQAVSVEPGKSYTVSIYAKAGERSSISLQVFGNSTTYIDAVGSTTLDGDWVRLSKTIDSASYTSLQMRILFSGSAVTWSGTQGIYLWGAQLEESSTVGQYVKTTTAINSAPRFDHDPTTGESLGLLVEESRQNLLVQSEDFSQSWYNFGTTDSLVSITNPAGGSTAFKLIETAATEEHGIYQTTSTSGDNTFTVFAKAAERRYIVLRRDSASLLAVFDLQTGTVTQTDAGVIASISDSGNGWYRCSMTCANTQNTVIKISLDGTGIATQNAYTGDGTSGIYIWGAQLEAGSFPTSYIPTEGSTVTRAADVASITGTNFSSWYEQSEGTVFNDSTVIAPNVQTQTVWLFTGGTYSTSLRQPQGTGDRFRAQIGNTFTPSPGTGNTLSTGTRKACVAYSGTAGRLQVGSSSNDVTAAGVSDATDFYIGSLAGGSTLNGTISRLTYWPTRLSNDTLQTITV